MELTLDQVNHPYLIQRYSNNSITINEQTYSSSLIIGNGVNPSVWSISDFSLIASNDLQPLIANKPDVVVIGTGDNHCYATAKQTFFFNQHGIGVEIMATPAACRTFNVLLSENRHVVAGIIIKDIKSNKKQ